MADSAQIGSLTRLTRLAADVVAPGDLQQVGDGRAGAYTRGSGATTGQAITLEMEGVYRLPKATGFSFLDGGRVYWDRSGRTAYYKKVLDRDYYVGRAVGDALTSDTTVTVALNADPRCDVDLSLDPFISVLVGTPAAGGFGYPVQLGGAHILELTATSEAQKVDLLSVDGFAPSANPIIEFAFRVLSDGGTGSQDFSIGLASGTHASDFESVAELATVHLDGNDTKVYAESDDGTTDVNPTDTTTTYTEGSTQATRVEGWIDCRDLTAVKFYINGSRVLSGTTFSLVNAAGPWFLIAHLEKASGTDVYKIAVDWLRARLMES